MLLTHDWVFSLYRSCFFQSLFFFFLYQSLLLTWALPNSHPAFHWHKIVNITHRFPVCRDIVATFPYFCVGNVKKIMCILLGETWAPKQSGCTALLGELHGALLTPLRSSSRGEDTAKSAPSRKEEIVSVLLKGIPQRAEESKCRKPEKTYCNWGPEAQTD